jgi:uncharacterized membrane protein YraQ (UPF0718 family)
MHHNDYPPNKYSDAFNILLLCKSYTCRTIVFDTISAMLRAKTIFNLVLLTLSFLVFMVLPFVGSPKTLAVLACGSADACERAARTCTEGGGTWNSTTGTCSGSSGSSSSATIDGQIDVDGSSDEIFKLIQNVINILFGMIAFVVIGMVIVAGIQYSTASGSPQATTDAKKKISNAVLALVLLAFLYPFLQWLVPGGTFG